MPVYENKEKRKYSKNPLHNTSTINQFTVQDLDSASQQETATPLLTNEFKQGHYVNHSKLPAGTKLSEIAMLGSHDAGTYAYSRRKSGFASSLGSLLPAAFKTQNRTLRQQAEAGARYFDIRVAQNKDGSFSFFHGPSVAGSDAVSDVKSLLEYAAGDTNHFYLLKLVFKGEKGQSSAAASSNTFLQSILEGHQQRLITLDDTSSLGEAMVDLLDKGKNIGIMVDRKKYDGTEPHWGYKESVNTKWANRANAEETANFLLKFHENPVPDKLNIMQTNIPVASVGRGQFTSGVKRYLFGNRDPLIKAVAQLPAGIISADYVGDSGSATSKFMETINQYNRSLMERDEETRL
ncbi:hypothetical protein AB204_00490 [Xenorhabdus khoisanae]|uniref:Phosphatidylinositol diacylglycerol-lyase n=1 Tax=Xenorhabdus khoisanae TaxID=880157 RepID=A0A0J5FXU7_9GAMM|nr:hypothetical protein [Xenorhabdus khoisanae]KMJ47008.1 hypothetical protein AB204_00490 [Xenorhabdus khoisanae]